MSEAEKQEGQKTVVAFITGLLIGGLLVWVFSASPEQPAPESPADETTAGEETEQPAGETPSTPVEEAPATEETSAPGAAEPRTGAGSISVSDQKASDLVTLGAVTFPEKAGWVVVRDYTGKGAGKILGAARYNLDDGLVPSSVSLLRSTEAGSMYQVQFYTENGDKKFSTTNDKPIEAGSATFTAN